MSRDATTLPDIQFRINHLIWIGILLVAAVDGVWLRLAGMQLDFAKITVIFYIFPGFVAISLFYRHVRRDDTLCLLGHIACQMLIATGVLGILSYLTAGQGGPLLDEKMIAIDRWFFFDWRGYIGWVNDTPWLADILTPAYQSSGPQIIVLIALLFLRKQSMHIQRLIIAYLSAALITIILAMLFPAVAGYIHYNIDLAAYPNLHPAAARLHEEAYLAMRSGAVTTLSFPLQGIVTFPSFHSTLAVLMMYAAWPLVRLRWWIVALNLLVLMSVPVDGGHWLVDILGGVAIAPPVIWLAEKILPSRPQAEPPPMREV